MTDQTLPETSDADGPKLFHLTPIARHLEELPEAICNRLRPENRDRAERDALERLHYSLPGIIRVSLPVAAQTWRAVQRLTIDRTAGVSPPAVLSVTVPPLARTLLDRLPASPWLAHALRVGFEQLPRALVRPFLMRFLTTALGLSRPLLDAGAMLVNAHGERFADERDRPAHATANQPDGKAYVMLDARLAARFSAWPHYVSTAPGIAYAYLDDYRRARPDVFHRARTLDALARHLGLDPQVLRRSFDDRNALHDRPPLDTPPWTVLGPLRAYLPFTEGGLAVDTSLRVLHANGTPIPGVFAAGANGQGGLLLEGHGHHLGWAFVSGRLAGRAAADAI
jgi:hypothetical protein